jgi:hypothetical protein
MIANLKSAFSHLGKIVAREQTEAEAKASAEKTYKALTRKAAAMFVDGKPHPAADAEKLFSAATTIGRAAEQVHRDISVAIEAEQLRRIVGGLADLQAKMTKLKDAKREIGQQSPGKAYLRKRAQQFEILKQQHAAAKAAVQAARDAGQDPGAAEIEELKLRHQRGAFDSDTATGLKQVESRLSVEVNLARETIAAVQAQIREVEQAKEKLQNLETENGWLFDAPDAAAVDAARTAERRKRHIVRDTSPPADTSKATYPVVVLESMLATTGDPSNLEFVALPGQNQSEVVELADLLLRYSERPDGARRMTHVVYLREMTEGPKIPNTNARRLIPDSHPAPGPAARQMTLFLHELIGEGASFPNPAGYSVIPWAGQSVREVESLKKRWSDAISSRRGPAFDDVARSRHADRIRTRPEPAYSR